MTVQLDDFNKFKQAVEERFAKVEENLSLNTASTSRTEKNTQEIVQAFDAAKGAFKTLEFIGKLAKPFMWILGLGAIIASNVAALKAWAITLITHIVK